MRRVDSPPVVGENVEDTQHYHQECSRPFGLEANGDHDTSGETDGGNEDTAEAPFTLDDKPKEEEYQKDTTSKKETDHIFSNCTRKESWGRTISYDHFPRALEDRRTLIYGRPSSR